MLRRDRARAEDAGAVEAALQVLATDLSAEDTSLIVPPRPGKTPPAALGGEPAGHPDRPDATTQVFTRALELFAAGQRVDMRSLAAELGIGRTSLYRRVGSRDRLLGELTWHLLQTSLAEGVERSRGRRGADRLAAAVAVYMEELGRQGWLRAFLQREPQCALRVLLARTSAPQRGLSRAVYTLLEIELQRGNLAPGLRPELLAYPVVRICESFVYLDLVNGHEPDPRGALEALEALMHSHTRAGEESLPTFAA